MRKFLQFSLVTSLLAFSATMVASAQSLLPSFVEEITTGWQGASATQRITGFIRLALTLAFGAVILVAVVYSILAAIKYIRSGGEAGEVEEANKAIKAIFQGVVAMFVGIIGVVLVFFIFDVALPNPSLPAVCLKKPDSIECQVCSEGKKGDDGRYVFNDVTYDDITDRVCNSTD